MTPPRQLTPDQIAAVECPQRVCFLLAPAGSGKTEVLIQRVIRILDASRGESFRVLAVTFTLKAAEELRQRVERTVGDEAWRVDADTIHGFSLDWLRRFGTPVGVSPDVVVYADKADRFSIIHQYLETLGQSSPDEKALAKILNDIDDLRTALLAPEKSPADPVLGSGLSLPDIYDAYVSALDGLNAIDFPGMLSKFIDLLALDPSVVRRFRRTYHHVLVDEGQDLTKAQAELLKALVGEALSLFVVADARQSIHGWAGGGIQWARELVGPDARELKLEHNFRCATLILELAGRVAEHFATHRTDAASPPGSPPGNVQVRSAKDESEEARIVADWIEGLLNSGLEVDTLVKGESPAMVPEEIGVIGRSRYSLDEISSELTDRGRRISMRTEVASLLTTSEARLLHALLEVQDNPDNRPAVRRVYEELQKLLPQAGEEMSPPDDGTLTLHELRSGVSSGTIAHVIRAVEDLDDTAEGLERFLLELDAIPIEGEGWAADLGKLRGWWREYRTSTRAQDRSLRGLLLYLFRVQRTRPDEPGIRLLTAHRAKGLEFRAVAVLGLTQGGFPDYRSVTDPEALDEERRAFYVAVTRASRALLLTWPQIRTSRYGQRRVVEPSQFLLEAGVVP